jgi:hypothetical protein
MKNSKIGTMIKILFNEIKLMKRINPNPPNFNSTPARIIDPKVGASTCAIGNQKCKPYTGSLTQNLNITIKLLNTLTCALSKFLLIKNELP